MDPKRIRHDLKKRHLKVLLRKRNKQKFRMGQIVQFQGEAGRSKNVGCCGQKNRDQWVKREDI